MKLFKRPLSNFVLSSLLITPFLFSPVASAEESETIRFSVPPWPGVTVKTQVASTLLDSLGYKTNKQEIGATITYQALAQNELDVFLAAWLPAQQGM